MVMPAQGLKTLCLNWRILVEKSRGVAFSKFSLKQIQEWALVFKNPQNISTFGGAAK